MTNHPWNEQNSQAADDQTVPLSPQQVQATVAPATSQEVGQSGPYQYQDAQGNYQPYPQAQGVPLAFGPSPETQGKKRQPALLTLAATALVAALVGGGVGGALVASSGGSKVSTLVGSTTGTTIVNDTDEVNAVTAAVAKALPSSVTIAASSSTASGSGSGVILDAEGHILTNTHVVTMDGATASADIEVQLADGTVRPASIVGTDPTSDLAVIKLQDITGLALTPATLGDSDSLNVGEGTIAIGAPLGLENTVTTGIVSNLLRTIEVASSAVPEGQEESSSSQDPLSGSPFQFEIPGQQSSSASSNATIAINVIQTDAAVNPGNSGGALLNSQGEVIGINVAIASTETDSSSASGSIGVGFALPVNYAKRVAQEIIETGSATHGLLGARISSSPAYKDSSEAFGDGAVIQEVVSGGAAEAAGLREGDVVVAVNGRAISEALELTAAVRQAAAGERVTLTIERSGSTQEVEVTLGDAAQAS